MYRQILDTPEQFLALRGQLVRMEYGDTNKVIGIVTGGDHRSYDAAGMWRVEFDTRHHDGIVVADQLLVIGGTYAVYVTTADEPLRENEIHPPAIRWRDHIRRNRTTSTTYINSVSNPWPLAG